MSEAKLLLSLLAESASYYHGSNDHLPIGTILTPRNDYESRWMNTDFYSILEKHKPADMLSHRNSIFMCSDPDDIDLAGGGTEWLFTVIPLGRVEKHDLNWSSEISCLMPETSENVEAIKQAALNYWYGVPHHDENVWEYLTSAAKVVVVERY